MNCRNMYNEGQPMEVVVLSDAVYHSYLGEYFFGQTDSITFDNGFNAWGGLFNPASSMVNLFLNAYTISNFSNESLTAEGWLSSTFSGNARISENSASGNQAACTPSQPQVKIISASSVNEPPSGGTYTFVRRVEPNLTLTKHDFQGMYIIPPGSSFVLYFLSPGRKRVSVRIAFGWWEEKVNPVYFS